MLFISFCYSVNKIGSLSDFQFCRNLQELYVRKNEIRDLNQIMYLQDLPRLKSLWLEENPCADTDAYRHTVLRTLPNLQKLDNVTVQPEEVQDAMRKGRELVHPEDMVDVSPTADWASGSSSPAHSPTQHEEYMTRVYYEEYEDVERPSRTPSSGGQRSPPRRQGVGEREIEQTETRRPSSIIQDDDQHIYYETDRRNANYETETPVNICHSEFINMDVSSNGEEMHRSSSGRCCHGSQAACDSSSDGSASSSQYGGRSGRGDEHYDRQQMRVSVSEKGNSNSRPPYPRRPVTRSSNILSAVLCLIKELDYPNLEVVEMAVRSRMDEL
ncbi:hypothetical protein C0J52_10607 [Blattella germanica]|nr:hypothetical protein C0J52_10607 [Blattella germanica]